MSSQVRNAETQSLIRADTPYPAILKIGHLDADAGAVASFDFTGIPGTFTKLILDLYARGDTAATSVIVRQTFNNDGSAIYDSVYENVRHSATMSTAEALAAAYAQVCQVAAATAPASAFDMAQIEIGNYANTNGHKTFLAQYTIKINTTSGSFFIARSSGWYRSTNAISRITLTPSAGNFAQYSSANLYGVY